MTLDYAIRTIPFALAVIPSHRVESFFRQTPRNTWTRGLIRDRVSIDDRPKVVDSRSLHFAVESISL
jgi:hypothetical protein